MINALVVNAESRMPGDGYNHVPGCSVMQWPKQVEDCIRCTSYPQVV